MNSGGPAAAFHNLRRHGVSAPHVPPGGLGKAGPAGLGPARWGLFLRFSLGRAESGAGCTCASEAASPWACGPCPPSSLGATDCGAQGPTSAPFAVWSPGFSAWGPGRRSVDLQPSPAWAPLALQTWLGQGERLPFATSWVLLWYRLFLLAHGSLAGVTPTSCCQTAPCLEAGQRRLRFLCAPTFLMGHCGSPSPVRICDC